MKKIKESLNPYEFLFAFILCHTLSFCTYEKEFRYKKNFTTKPRGLREIFLEQFREFLPRVGRPDGILQEGNLSECRVCPDFRVAAMVGNNVMPPALEVRAFLLEHGVFAATLFVAVMDETDFHCVIFRRESARMARVFAGSFPVEARTDDSSA